MKYFVLAFFVIVSKQLFPQSIGDYQSHQSGSWNVTSSWERWDGTAWISPAPAIPNSSSGTIKIQSLHQVDVTATIAVDQVLVDSGAVILVNASRTLTITGVGVNLSVAGSVVVAGTLTTTSGITMILPGGKLIRQQGSSINSFFSTLYFQNGALFEHQVTSASTALSAATFDPNSTLIVDGYTGSGTFSSSNWSVPLGNVVYNCPGQGSGTVNFAGLLKNVRGDMDVRNTGLSGKICFNSSDTSTLEHGNEARIGGHFSVLGSSRIFTTSTGNVELYVGGDFIFNPDSVAAPSQCATSGRGVVYIGGNTLMNSGAWDFATGSSGQGIFNISNDFSSAGAIVTKSGGVNSHASLNFYGTTSQQSFDPTGISSAAIDVRIDNMLGIKLTGNYVLGGTLNLLGGDLVLANSTLTLNGPIFQTSGLIGSELDSSPSLIVGGLGAMPPDLAIREGSIFTRLELNRSSDTLVTSSTFVIDSNLTVTSGTLMSKGSIHFRKTSTISGAGIKLFNNLTIAEGDSLISAVNLTVKSKINNDGMIHCTAGTMTFDGAVSLSGNGSNYFSGVSVSPLARVIADFQFEAQGSLTIDGDMIVNGGLNAVGSVTVSSTGSMTINNSSLAVHGMMTVSSGGRFTATDTTTFLLAGNLSVNGTLTSMSTTFFNGNTTMTGTGAKSFNDIVLSGVLTPNAAYSINGDLTLTGNGVLNPGNNTTTFSGHTSILTNFGTGSATFYRVTINAGDTLTANSYFNVNSTFTSRGAFFSNAGFATLGTLRVSPTTGSLIASNRPISVGGTLTVSSKAIFTANFGADVTLAANISVTGMFNSLSTVTFSGSTTLSGSGEKTFNHVVITGSFTPNAAYSIAGNLEVPGTLNPGSATTSFSGTTIISGSGNISFNSIQIKTSARLTSTPGRIMITGNLINDGVFESGEGTVVFSGNGSKVISSSLSTPLPMNFTHIILDGGSGVIDLTSEMDINLFGVLTMNTSTDEATFDVDGVHDNRIFRVRSLGDNPAIDGSIAALTPKANILGKITVERYVSGEGRLYRYISCPVSDATVADWQGGFAITGNFDDPTNSDEICGKSIRPDVPSLFYYDETVKNYVAFPSSGLASANPLIVGRGYAAFIRKCSDPTVISATGILVEGLNRGSVNLPVTHTDIVSSYNNLIGNPFPAPISWDSLTINGISSTMAIRDNGQGVFRYYTRNGIGANDIPNGIISQGQAFWVRTTHANPSVLITENAKTLSDNSVGGIFYKTKAPDLLEILLSGSSQIAVDKAYLMLSEESNASNDLDNLDAPKMNNQLDDPFSELFDVFTRMNRDGLPLALNALPSITCKTHVQLGVKDGKEGSYTFSFKKSGALSGLSLFLIDQFVGQTTAIDEGGQYSFVITADTGSQSLQRFELTFADQPIDLNISVESSKPICGSGSAWVTLASSQSGMHYSLLIHDKTLIDTIGNGEPILIRISPDALNEGENKAVMVVSDGCTSLRLNRAPSIWKYNFRTASAFSVPQCLQGSIVMYAHGASPGGSYRWYEDQADSAILFSGSPYVTPYLQKSQSYYLAAIDSLGFCEGERVEARAVVLNYDSARITLKDENTLQSNYIAGNRWYWNGQLLSDTTSYLQIHNPGLYTLKVSIENCVTTDERMFSVVGTRANNQGLLAYPNPVTGMFYLESSDKSVYSEEIVILNSMGVSLGTITMTTSQQGKKGQFDFTAYSPGLYFIRINSDLMNCLKILKR